MIARGLLGAAALLLLAGCTADPGPLLLDQDVTQCMPSDLYSDVLVGVAVENPGREDATLTDLDFPSLDGVEVADAWLVDADPQDDGTTLGYGVEAYPIDASTRPSWEDRVPVAGSTIAGGHSTFIALHLLRLEPDAVVDGVAVTYRIGSATHTVQSNVRIEFASAGCTG